MGWPTTFALLAGGTQPLSLFDAMFNQVAAMIAIPCTATGQNSIALAPIGNAPTLTAYSQFNFFRFVAAQTSNAPASAQFASLALLPIYKADGLTQAGPAGDIAQGQEYVLIYAAQLNGGVGGFFLENAAVPVVQPVGGGVISGLQAINNAGDANHKIDIGFVECVMTNAAGNPLRATNVNATIDLTSSGAVNKLDTGAIAANKNYYTWAISNGSVSGFLASLSSTVAGLTLPAGYTFTKRVGSWRTAVGSAQLMGMFQAGNKLNYLVGTAQTTTAQRVATGTTGDPITPTYTSFPLTNFVPPTAASYDLSITMGLENSGSGLACAAAPNNAYGGVNSTTNPPPLAYCHPTGLTVNGNALFGTFLGAGPVFFASASAAGGLFIHGWTDNL